MKKIYDSYVSYVSRKQNLKHLQLLNNPKKQNCSYKTKLYIIINQKINIIHRFEINE